MLLNFLAWILLTIISPSITLVIVLWILLEAWPLLIKVFRLEKQPFGHQIKVEKMEWFNNCLKHFWMYSFVPLVQHWEKVDLGSKSPRINCVRVNVDINSVILDLTMDAQLEPRIFDPLEKMAVNGTVRLIFKKLVPNDLRLFGEVQITLIHPWAVNYQFQGMPYVILNCFVPLTNWILSLMLCQNYSICMKNPYPSTSNAEDYTMRWRTSKIDKIIVIQINPISQEKNCGYHCSCLTCMTPLTFLSKGNHRSKVQLMRSPIEIVLPYNGTEEITIESLKPSLNKKCQLRSKPDFSLALNLNKRYQGEVCINGAYAQVMTEIHPLHTSVLVLKIVEIQCQEEAKKIEPLLILRLTGQDHIQHTNFGLESNTWTFDEEFAFLIENEFSDKLIIDLVNCKDYRGKIKQDDLNAVEVFAASVANEDTSKRLGRRVLRVIDQDFNKRDKYMELDIGNHHKLKIVINLCNSNALERK